jgi:exonuclease SbcC
MKVLHTCDLHLRASRGEESLRALDTIGEIAIGHMVDLIAITGDTWDGAVQNTAGAMLSVFVERIRRLADIAPVVMIYGTPSHDTAGSLEIFEQVESRHGITILRPGKEYFFNDKTQTVFDDPEVAEIKDSLLIFGVPEPSKRWIAPLAGDKEAAEDGGRKALRNLFLALAAKRREHAELPCLLLYHGEIAGATTATGYQSEANTNLVVTREDIEAVGADYVACGHIHEPQKIGKNISYAGSAFPQNWGETHQAGVNVVEIFQQTDAAGEDFITTEWWHDINVKRVDLPFPQRVKIDLKARERFDADVRDVEGKLVWVEITGTQQEIAEISTEEIENNLAYKEALEGSRVTLNILPTETVRAEEIAEATNLRRKVAIWAESSGEEVAESVLNRADALEEEAARSGQVGDGAHIRIDRLVLRGAIGIWRGTGLDTIEIDFADYEHGLIAMIGSNGRGKTTLIENMHPWPQMLTRDGKLQDHFRLRDSYRDLYFTDERSGVQYRALMQIDGQNKSGSVDYYLYRCDDELRLSGSWEPLPDINGRREPYVEAIERLYGSLALYLRSAFISQRPTKGNPDLSDATKGERKALFRELAGLDYLQAYAEAAKERAKALESEIATDTGRCQTLESLVDGIPEIKERIATGRAAVKDIDAVIGQCTDSMSVLEGDLKAAQKRLEAARETSRKVKEIGDAMAHLSGEARELERSAESYRAAFDKREAARKAIGEYERLTAERDELQRQYQRHLESEKEILAEWYKEKGRRQTERDEYRAQIAENERSMNELRREEAAVETMITSLTGELKTPISETCPTCGQSWPAERKEQYLGERAEKEGRLAELQKHALELAKDIKSLEQAISSDIDAIDAIADPEKPNVPEWDEAPLRKIENDLEWIEIEAEREILQKADVAEAKLEGIEQRAAAIEADIKRLDSELAAWQQKEDPEAEKIERGARIALEGMQAKLAAERERRATYNARLEELEGQLSGLKEKRAEAEKLQAKLAANRAEARDWQYLQRACGPDGIQALELDALAPSIAQVANRLLAAAYDSRFRIEFRTTRIGGSGSRVKQMETFEVYIHDTEAGTEQELKTLSGGESVWIKKAIYDAFGIIRAQNTGTKFTTAFFDEADGALDPEARERYFRMLEAAHAESGRRHTIVITHSREIQEMIEQRIVMDELVEAREEVMVNG